MLDGASHSYDFGHANTTLEPERAGLISQELSQSLVEDTPRVYPLSVGNSPKNIALSDTDREFIADALELGLAMQARFIAEPSLAKGKPELKPATPEVAAEIDRALEGVILRSEKRRHA